MNDEFFNKFNSSNFFDNQFIILMSIVFKSNKITVIFKNARSSNNRSLGQFLYIYDLTFLKEGPICFSMRLSNAVRKELRKRVKLK